MSRAKFGDPQNASYKQFSVCDNKWCLCMSLYIHIRIDRIEWYVSNSWRHNRTRQKFAMPKGATSPRPLGTVLKRRKHHNSCAMSSQRPRFADLIQVAFLPVGSLPSNWDVKTSCQLHQLPYQIKAGYLCGAPWKCSWHVVSTWTAGLGCRDHGAYPEIKIDQIRWTKWRY